MTGREALHRAWHAATIWTAANGGDHHEACLAAFNDWHEEYERQREVARALMDKVGPARTARHDQGRY